MEQNFSDLALAKFLQSSPELGNLILSFKDVSDDLSEDNGVSVGVFILRAGEEVFYVPVVSKMENVYPIDSIFWASRSKFFPITKKTIGLILNSSQLTQGKGRKIPSTVVTNPDLTSLINPPRTGKYVAASTSRLGDFMAALPDYLKDFAMEKIAEEKSVYQNLHNMFSIRDIFAALKARPQALAAETNAAPISIVTGAATNLTDEEIAHILDKGYAVRGEHKTNRLAIAAHDYESGKFTKVVEMDGNSDYEVVFSRGNSREAFIPKINTSGHSCDNSRSTVALFTNGDYAIADAIVAKGERLDRKNVLNTIFNYNPPVLPRDVSVGESFAILDGEANLVGVFNADKVTLTHLGVEIDAYCRAGLTSGTIKICAYRHFGSAPTMEGKNLYVPFSTLVLKLGEDLSYELERSVNSASRRAEITQNSLLGDQLALSYDGVEFSVNNKAIGQEKAAMERLVIEEGIDPVVASSFVKQAKENKIARIYLSKQAAAFQAGEIPQFGNKLPPAGQVGLNGSFIPNVQNAINIGDAQATEATIISELLQAPDMYELIEEYIPDLEEALDRLGRIMFLSRVHITQLSENNDADSVFAFLAQLKAVYRMLGDNLIKLQELLALRPNNKK